MRIRNLSSFLATYSTLKVSKTLSGAEGGGWERRGREKGDIFWQKEKMRYFHLRIIQTSLSFCAHSRCYRSPSLTLGLGLVIHQFNSKVYVWAPDSLSHLLLLAYTIHKLVPNIAPIFSCLFKHFSSVRIVWKRLWCNYLQGCLSAEACDSLLIKMERLIWLALHANKPRGGGRCSLSVCQHLWLSSLVSFLHPSRFTTAFL